MTDYTINPVEHNEGGKNTPYEKYHLTENEHSKATRLATSFLDGLMPSALYGTVEYVDPPVRMSDPGEIGQRASDDEYIYYYTSGGWRRVFVKEFLDSSSSSSSQSSSSSSSSNSSNSSSSVSSSSSKSSVSSSSKS